jgi:hypothetical protein
LELKSGNDDDESVEDEACESDSAISKDEEKCGLWKTQGQIMQRPTPKKEIAANQRVHKMTQARHASFM